LIAATILRGRRRGAVVLTALAVAALAAGPAYARHYIIRHGGGGGSAPPYAAIVVDGNSGSVLHAANPDESRHPASLTKIMTLYLLFERLEAGKLKLDSDLDVSAHAAGQSPTKLGLKAGDTIEVDSAIRGLVTRSANDAAVVIAEAIGGTERDFAEMMTHKAHALGMSRTVYRNASGLPDDDQVTTARDQALLGRAIQERFPKYYRYFSTESFTYHGVAIRNHNMLLGRVDGVDGIKTGYTAASGFNLVTSVHRNNRYLVAVVLGGPSAGARDARMRSLIDEYVRVASVQKSAPMIAERDTRLAEVRLPDTRQPDARVPEARQSEPKTFERTLEKAADAAKAGRGPAQATAPSSVYAVASYTRPIPWPTAPAGAAAPATVAAAQPAAAPEAAEPAPARPNPAPPAVVPGAEEPLRPIAVRTLKVKLPPNQVADLAAPASAPTDGVAPRADQGTAATPVTRSIAPPADAVPVREVATSVVPQNAPAPQRAPAQSVPVVHSGWMVQVGAYDDERAAHDKLNAAQSKASLLAHAEAFTEPITKGDKTLYRARFAGLARGEAEQVCRQLRRNDIACMTVRN
jgi:D-alanyl-D-alanine carboxypeptidase